MDFPDCLLLLLSISVFLLFSFFLFLHFLVVSSVRQIKLTYVGFRAHVKIASRIVSYRKQRSGHSDICTTTIIMFAITEHRSCLRLHRPFSQNLCLICINTAIASSLNYRCKQGLGSKTKAMNYLGLFYLYITDCRAVSTLQACHYRQGCSPIVNLLTC